MLPATEPAVKSGKRRRYPREIKSGYLQQDITPTEPKPRPRGCAQNVCDEVLFPASTREL